MSESLITDTPAPEAPPSPLAVGVQFEKLGHIVNVLCGEHDLLLRDQVIVDIDKQVRLATVITPPVDVSSVQAITAKVVRKATQQDLLDSYRDGEEERHALGLCRRLVADHQLPMKVTQARHSVSEHKTVFMFTAENRVDFRQLIKDLSGQLRMRVELRQIGARDEARIVGAIGPCGLQCCCNRHIREFKSVTIAMAKDQQLSPNPTKLAGMCGKLKCCLSYEHELYKEEKKTLPNPGKRVSTPHGRAYVTGLDVLRRICIVRLEETGEEHRVPADDVKLESKDPK